ncbi:MAG: hypothetical protein A2Z73_07195 [Deltaproteobacteria bacterium RBG_13_60_28]|nr:MAG: hypothetical protein A2Z73_07195 [Deltaproteobacteria bacterium RBG_13_60_28]
MTMEQGRIVEQDRPGPGAANPPDLGGSKWVLCSPHREPAFLASCSAAPRPRRGPGRGFSSRQMERELLASLLKEHSRAGGIQELALSRNPLGKPYLWLEGLPGPPISFSRSAGRLWAALGTPRSWLGLDAASPEEFAGSYPFKRVFQETEWQAATSLTRGDREEAGALLWSVKEAVVKARGCGYHFFGPRRIHLEFAGLGEHGPCWRGHLETPVPDLVDPGSQGIIPAASVRLHEVWLSVAWMTVAPGEALAPVG